MSAPASGLAYEERLHHIWNRLRLVALDFETTGSGASVRVVAVAAITMRNQMVTGSWSSLVNPGVPISAATTKVHGITDDHVRNEPTFDDLRDQLLSTLTPADPDEVVVLAAHNAAFDIGVLRTELDRHPDTDGVLHQLPTVAVLDTYATEFHDAAGIRPKRRTLAAVAEHLGVALTAAHNATGDALACAQVAAALLARTAARGHHEFADIHALAGGKTTTDHPTSTVIRRGTKPATLSEVHAATHTRTIPPNPTGADWEQWKAAVAACVHNACPRLTDRLHAAPFTVEHNRRLMSVARDFAKPDADGKVNSIALNTIAHALSDNLGRVLGTDGTDTERRLRARPILDAWERILAAADRCSGTSGCPGCTAAAECGRDTWWRPLVPALRGRFPHTPALPDPRERGKRADDARGAHKGGLAIADAWFRPERKQPTGLVATAAHHQVVANYAVWTVIEWHLAAGRLTEADTLATRAVTWGYLDPRTVNHHLTHLTAARRAGDIATALTLCSQVLATRDGSTDAGWHLLTSRAAHLAGVQERLGVTYEDQVDEDGNLIAKRRHHPESPRRFWALRFARDPDQNKPTAPGNWVRIPAAARYLHTTPHHITQLAAAGILTAHDVAGIAWFDTADLDRHREASTAGSAARSVPLRKTERRPLPKQSRRPSPGRSKP